jgi:hypothetical protein
MKTPGCGPGCSSIVLRFQGTNINLLCHLFHILGSNSTPKPLPVLAPPSHLTLMRGYPRDCTLPRIQVGRRLLARAWAYDTRAGRRKMKITGYLCRAQDATSVLKFFSRRLSAGGAKAAQSKSIPPAGRSLARTRCATATGGYN